VPAGTIDVAVNRYYRDQFTAVGYEYDGPRVVRFAEYIAGPPPRRTGWYTVSWNPAGGVERIADEHHPDAPPVYQAPARKLRTVLAEAQRLLIDRIPAALRGFTPLDRVSGLALGFNVCDRWELMPPQLGLRVAAQRSAYLNRPPGQRDIDELWDPTVTSGTPGSHDFPAVDFADEELRALGIEVAMLAHTEQDLAAVTQCHVRVAKALNRLDWRPILPVTDDFVVYPIDYEDNRYLDLIEAAVPAARLRQLRATGLLPTS
jgi:hypothetical protein